MKIITTITTFILFITALNQVKAEELDKSDFKIEEISGRYFIKKKDKDLKLFEVQEHHPDPKVLDVLSFKEAPHLSFIIYPAGFTGTSVVASYYKAAIYDQKKGLFIGDILYKIQVNEGIKDKEMEIKASWKFRNGQLNVFKEDKLIETIDY